MKMKLLKIKKYLQQKFSRKVLVPQTTADFTSRVNKSYVPFTCKFPMIMHFVSILHSAAGQKPIFIFLVTTKLVQNCASFRFFLAVFMEKFQKIRYLNYVRKTVIVLLYRIKNLQFKNILFYL